jgi:hypothetical protein
MDGKKSALESAIEGAGMSAPKMRLGAEKSGENTRNTGLRSSIKQNERLKPNLSSDFRFGGGYADCP